MEYNGINLNVYVDPVIIEICAESRIVFMIAFLSSINFLNGDC